MSTPPYIDATGFHVLGLTGWVADLTALWASIFGTDKDFSSHTPDGQLINGIAARFANLEQLAQQVYLSRSPAGAVGVGLSRLVGLNGITRKPAQPSAATVTLTGTPGTVIPINSLVGSSIDSTKPSFATTTSLTIGGGGTVTGVVQCTQPGPIPVAVNELSVIQSVVTGWTAVTNAAQGSPGSNVEADPALRARRAGSVALPSQSMLDGLEAALRAITGVNDARCYENTTGVPDAKGLPAHSIQCIVDPGSSSPSDIATTIFNKAGMGVTKVGGQSGNVTDANGDTQTMYWDNATPLTAYVVVKVLPAQTTSVLLYLSQQLGKAIEAYFSAVGDLPARIGQNIPWFDLATPINALGLTGRPGLPNVTAVYLGNAANPTTQADLVVPYNQIASFSAANVAVINGP